MKNKNDSHRSFWTWKSPVGMLLFVGDSKGLRELNFQDGAHPMPLDPTWKEEHAPFQDVIKQLKLYFAGRLQTFQIPLSLNGTDFQLRVWKALQRIPYAATTSYGTIAKQIGNPKASRAIGAANGQNPVSIIVPCHRVIGKSGDLVGYGGGLPIKEALLDIERRSLRGI